MVSTKVETDQSVCKEENVKQQALVAFYNSRVTEDNSIVIVIAQVIF